MLDHSEVNQWGGTMNATQPASLGQTSFWKNRLKFKNNTKVSVHVQNNVFLESQTPSRKTQINKVLHTVTQKKKKFSSY